jgi:catechol 2,3-dioxygenase-like lactoylglutathione lyase family enzyme
VNSALHHLDLNVTDMKRSHAFYDRVLSHIGYRSVDYSVPDEAEGFDWLAPSLSGDRFSIGLYQARGSLRHDRYSAGVHHIALTAPSREAVDDLYGVLLDIGAQILNPPREYPEYEPGYYAVFFLDPDGIKLEYVFTPAVEF